MSHNDPLWDELSAALKTAMPAPDPDRRASVILDACENFRIHHQETGSEVRPTDNRTAQMTVAAEKGMTWMKRKAAMMFAGGTAITASLAALVLVNTSPSELGNIPNDLALTSPGVTVSKLDPIRQGRTETMEIAGADMAMADQVAPAPMAESFAQSSKAAPQALVRSAPAGLTAMASSTFAVPDVAVTAPSNDRFVGEEINSVKVVSEEPVSTFSIDVDTASWTFARRMIQNGQIPSPEMVRIEEMVNYFDYGYVAPSADAEDPFATHVSVFDAPWNEGKQLVRIGIQGIDPEIEDRPPLDLAFLIDTSGSMNSPDKLGLLKQSLMLMLPELNEGDRVGIVVYAGSAGVVLEMTDATSVDEISEALERLSAGGSTAGAAGLKAAYDMIGNASEEGRIGRVILATDGDFNVGLSTDDALKSFIEDRREDGAYLSVLGFGAGNYNDGLMQTLAQNGNGQAAYIDTLSEARKVLVDQLSGALYPIANDVKIQVEFNPAQVQEYRLIGYETRALNREDFNNDKVDAGEIGAGHQVTALYEITPVWSDAAEMSPLRYGGEVGEVHQDIVEDLVQIPELGYVNLRYKDPGSETSTLIGTPIFAADGTIDNDAGFAAAIAGFAQLMKDDRYMGDWSYADAAALASKTKGEDLFGYRAEAVRLIHLMEVLDR
jgi:Ca-activated chloride channel family protein